MSSQKETHQELIEHLNRALRGFTDRDMGYACAVWHGEDSDMSQFDSGMSGYIRAKAPESAEPSKPAREPERWRFFVADQYRPAGMSPREDGEWVKWADAESYASERVAQLEKQVERLRAALRKLLDATSTPTEYDLWKKATSEAEAALATQLPTEKK